MINNMSVISCMAISFRGTRVPVTRIILRALSALSLDEVNIAKRNITTGLFGLEFPLTTTDLKSLTNVYPPFSFTKPNHQTAPGTSWLGLFAKRD
jgi:uncharacterized iron-regulated protein